MSQGDAERAERDNMDLENPQKARSEGSGVILDQAEASDGDEPSELMAELSEDFGFVDDAPQKQGPRPPRPAEEDDLLHPRGEKRAREGDSDEPEIGSEDERLAEDDLEVAGLNRGAAPSKKHRRLKKKGRTMETPVVPDDAPVGEKGPLASLSVPSPTPPWTSRIALSCHSQLLSRPHSFNMDISDLRARE